MSTMSATPCSGRALEEHGFETGLQLNWVRLAVWSVHAIPMFTYVSVDLNHNSNRR